MSVTLSRTPEVTPERGNNILNKIFRFFHVRPIYVVLRTMLRVPTTNLYHPIHVSHSQYPYVAERYRGLLALSEEACTGCKKCERICPNKTIIMQTREINGKEYRFPAYFAGRCMKCGLCEEVCDRQFAIRHTDQFEDAGYIREQLFYSAERMFDMWEKHIQPRIDAGIAHVAVPDKRRVEKEYFAEQEEKRKEQDKADPRIY